MIENKHYSVLASHPEVAGKQPEVGEKVSLEISRVDERGIPSIIDTVEISVQYASMLGPYAHVIGEIKEGDDVLTCVAKYLIDGVPNDHNYVIGSLVMKVVTDEA